MTSRSEIYCFLIQRNKIETKEDDSVYPQVSTVADDVIKMAIF